jgi:hypothetical protein
VFLPFSSQIEVLHILYKINNFIDYEGDAVYTEFSSFMENEDEEEMKPNDSLLVSSSKIIFILEMKFYLENAYCINQSKLEEYDPTAPSKMKNDKTVFRPIKPSFSFDSLKQLISKNDSSNIWKILEKSYMSHQEHGSTTLMSSSKKRKRNDSKDSEPKKRVKKDKKKKKKKKNESSEEEEEEDEAPWEVDEEEEDEEVDEE